MSLNPNLGHLYHDANISNIYMKLNVDDRLKTRAINAREAKSLNKYSKALDRAKTVCRSRNEWEQSYLRTELKDIKTKSPSLRKSLRLENERLKNRLNPSKSGTHLPDISQSQCMPRVNTSNYIEKQNPVLVSSWSVYSNRLTRNYSAPTKDSFYEDRNQQNCLREDCGVKLRSKSSGFTKKAEQVIKTLHKLYTDAGERKLMENNMTVLDVLGKKSREELEQALFVLRGSRAGDVIENILKEKELVSKPKTQTSKITKRSYSSSKSVSSESLFNDFTTRIRETTLEGMENDPFKDMSKEVIDTVSNHEHINFPNLCTQGLSPVHTTSYARSPNNISIKSAKSKSSGSFDSVSLPNKQWTQTPELEDMTTAVFKRDDTCLMSSTLANASDVDLGYSSMRWTDLFKTPELWKQNNKDHRNTKTYPKTLSLVTLTGKRRQTMIRR